MTVEVLNFGCRLNLAEGEVARQAASGHGPLTLVNSCAVTNESVRQARQAIRRARRRRPDARLIVTGCAAQLDPAGFAAMPEVDGVLDNRAKLQRESYANPLPPGGATRAASGGGELRPPVTTGLTHARAFVEVQTGCDHACTFCIIHRARGPNHSFPPTAIIDAVRAAVDRGQGEVVLTGVDVTSHAHGFGALVAAILREVPELPRLRLSSLDPAAIDPELEELLATHPRLMPHLHLSLQHGDDLILKRMRRRHLRAQPIALVARLKRRRPELAVGADLIAGFPTETEAMFAQSLAILDDCDVVHPHIFPFSPRTGTPAARMPQVAPPLVRERAAILREAAHRRREAWHEWLTGSRQRLLVERDGLSGHAENFAKLTLPTPHPPYVIVDVTVGDGLVGQPV